MGPVIEYRNYYITSRHSSWLRLKSEVLSCHIQLTSQLAAAFLTTSKKKWKLFKKKIEFAEFKLPMFR